MADTACFVMFQGEFELEELATALSEAGLKVRSEGAGCFVSADDEPEVWVAVVRGSDVASDAREIASAFMDEREDWQQIAACDARVEIAFDEDRLADVANTLIEVQVRAREQTGGYVFNLWNEVLHDGDAHEHDHDGCCDHDHDEDDDEGIEASEQLEELLWDALEQGVEAVRESGSLVPFVLLASLDAAPELRRFAADSTEEAIAAVRALVESSAESTAMYAMALDGYLHLEDEGRQDAIIVEAAERGGGLAHVLAHIYEPASEGAEFSTLDPPIYLGRAESFFEPAAED